MATALQLDDPRGAIDRLELEVERLHTRILDLQICLGACAALMRADIEGGKIIPSETRLRLLAKARE